MTRELNGGIFITLPLRRIASGPPEWHRKDDPEIGALLKAGHIYIASVLGDFITPAITIEGRAALQT